MNRISDDVTKVQETSNYEKNAYDGFPAVSVVCSGNENEYTSSAENRRVFAFNIRVYEQMNQNPDVALDDVEDSAKARAEVNVGEVVSELIDSFDKYFDLDGSVNGDFIFASPSAWGYVQLDNGWCRTALINLQYNKDFNVL